MDENIQLVNLKKYYKKKELRKKKRKKILSIFFICLLLCIIIFFGIFPGKNPINKLWSNTLDKGVKTEKLNIKTLNVPDYVDVQLIDTGNARSGIKMKHINDIVIHYTGNPGSTAQNNRDYFEKSTTEVCSHFVIGIDGKIIQCLPLDEMSAASNQRNNDTVSIEVCHSDESGEFSKKARNSLVEFTAWLCNNFDLSEKNIIRHYDITGKICPKYYVDNEEKWNELKKDIKKRLLWEYK